MQVDGIPTKNLEHAEIGKLIIGSPGVYTAKLVKLVAACMATRSPTDVDHVCLHISCDDARLFSGSTARIIFKREFIDVKTGQIRQNIYATDIMRKLSNDRAKRPNHQVV